MHSLVLGNEMHTRIFLLGLQTSNGARTCCKFRELYIRLVCGALYTLQYMYCISLKYECYQLEGVLGSVMKSARKLKCLNLLDRRCTQTGTDAICSNRICQLLLTSFLQKSLMLALLLTTIKYNIQAKL